jgi:hypothetical protein
MARPIWRIIGLGILIKLPGLFFDLFMGIKFTLKRDATAGGSAMLGQTI